MYCFIAAVAFLLGYYKEEYILMPVILYGVFATVAIK